MEEIMESGKPPKPPRPYDPERRTSYLPHAVAVAVVASVASAVFTGVTAWETHQDRVFTKNIYCTQFTYDVERDTQQEQFADQLGC